jgi:hypothetical protein
MPIVRVKTLQQLVDDKFLAVLTRRRPKGRDFFDIEFLKYRNIDRQAVRQTVFEYRLRGLEIDLHDRYEHIKERLNDASTWLEIQRDIREYMDPDVTKRWPDDYFHGLCSRVCAWVGLNLQILEAEQ